MNRIMAILVAVRRHLESPRLRHLPVLLVLTAVIGAMMLLNWMPAQKARSDQREIEVDRELKAIQSDLAEIERLKMRKPPPEVPINTIFEALSASLAIASPALSVAVVDSEHLRVQGTGRFDGIVRWLGDVQQSHRLSTTRMSVVRQKDIVVVDITLSSHRQ
jgi:type II secretory pathway component PulM